MKDAFFLAIGLLATSISHGAYIEPERAFELRLERAGAGRFVLVADIQPGFALYRDNFAVAGDGIAVARVDVPRGAPKEEPGMGVVELLTGEVRIPVTTAPSAEPAPRLLVTYLGCKLDDYCYPTQRAIFTLHAP